MAHVQDRDERIPQIMVGAGILLGLTVVVCGLLLGWPHLPGLLGEWFGIVIGIMTTPVFLEISFALTGLLIVTSINIWRRRKEGDDFVYLEQVTGPDVPEDMPEHARWAIFREKRTDAGEPTALEMVEGALAAGDHQAAAEWLGNLDAETLRTPEVLRLRLELARASGLHDLASRLQDEITNQKS